MASRARWAALLAYAGQLLLAALAACLLHRADRARLPRGEIAALQELAGAFLAWPRPRLRVSTLPGAFPGDEGSVAGDFARDLASALADEADVALAGEAPARLRVLAGCVEAGAAEEEVGTVRACLASAEAEAAAEEDPPLENVFDLLLAPSDGGPALLLDAGRGGVLRWGGGQAAAAGRLAGRSAIRASAAAARLRETWLRHSRLGDGSVALFELAPAYVFSFFLVGDCERRVAWDFLGGIFTPFLRRFFGRLQRLVDFEIDSQVVQCSSLGGSGGSVVDAATLKADFLRRAGEWPGDTVTRDARWLPPLVRFAAFKPSGHLRVVDEHKVSQRSFAVQGWGSVAIAGGEEDTKGNEGRCDDLCASAVDFVSLCEAQQVASAWVSSLRSWLGLPPDGPAAGGGNASQPAGAALGREDDAGASSSASLGLHVALPSLDGVAEWELLPAARAVHGLFLHRTAETLASLLALVDSLPDVAVKEEVSELAFQAAASAQRAAAAAADGDLDAALREARSGLALALAASHDDTVVAQLFFPWEYKYAVLMPIVLPVLFPVVISLFRQGRIARKKRKIRLATAPNAASPDAVAARAGDVG